MRFNKPHAESALAWGKQVYASVHVESKNKEQAEATALGCDQSTTHNYLDPNSPRQLAFGLVINSLYKYRLVAALAEKVGGVFIRLRGHVNGTDSDERAGVLRAMSKMQTEQDPSKIDGDWYEIEQLAARAREEFKLIEA